MDRFWFSVIRPCLSFIGARVIAEIGTGRGDTAVLAAAYCKEVGGQLHTIDTAPQLDVRAFEEMHARSVTCYRGPSLNILPHIPAYDAILIDGDHNWYTVFHELKLVERRRRETGVQPVVFVHDTGWPYGRRDLYYAIDLIPEEYRQESRVTGIDPLTNELSPVGLNPTLCHAIHAGGSRNGILTAVEDFLREHHDWQIVSVPGFFGLSILVTDPLLQAHPAFLKFLESCIAPSEEMETHLQNLEANRVEYMTTVKSFGNTNGALLQLLYAKEKEMEAWKKEAATHPTAEEIMKQVTHMEQTLSWRMTAPLRIAGKLLKQDIYVYNDIWISMGRPFPKTMRFLRHHAFKKFLPAQLTKKDDRPVSEGAVVIACHHTAMYLSDTLDSVFAQSLQPAEVVVVGTSGVQDDVIGALLPFLEKNIRYCFENTDTVEAALKTGTDATKSSFVVWMESGDVLQRDFLQAGFDLLKEDETVGAVCSDIRFFGAHRDYRPANDSPLETNQPVTGLIIRRQALAQAHGMDFGTLGWKTVRGMGLYLKRTAKSGEKMLAAGDNAPVPATLCLSLSGRTWAWPLMRTFLERQSYPHDLLHLMIVDTAEDDAFSTEVRRWMAMCDYKKTTYTTLKTGPKGLADLPRESVAAAVGLACSAIYNTFARMVDTPLVFTLEDDVIPEDDAFVRLQPLVKDDVLAASALYWHRDKKKPVAWVWDRGGPAFPEEAHGVQNVGGTGFGCLAIRGNIFKETIFQSGEPFGNYDHNFFATHTLNGTARVLLDWDCVCRHYQSPSVWF